jgi:hypothetical protein
VSACATICMAKENNAGVITGSTGYHCDCSATGWSTSLRTFLDPSQVARAMHSDRCADSTQVGKRVTTRRLRWSLQEADYANSITAHGSMAHRVAGFGVALAFHLSVVCRTTRDRSANSTNESASWMVTRWFVYFDFDIAEASQKLKP